MRSTVARPVLNDRERLSVFVTELLRIGSGPDPATRLAARQLLADLLTDHALTDDDRRLAETLLSLPGPTPVV